MHSSTFRDGTDLGGKDVLVVGVGNSALDIALIALRNNAASIRVACRHPAVILPVSSFGSGKPVDTFFNTRAYMDAPKFLRDYWFYSPVQKVMKAFNKNGLPAIPKGTPGFHVRLSNLKEHEAWTRALREGKISFVPKVLGLGPRTAEFDGGGTAPVDTVICCTGYNLEFPFLSAAVQSQFLLKYAVGGDDDQDAPRVNALLLHRRVMHPVHPSLCFFGMLSTLGNEAAVGELQGRWACAMLTGTGAIRCTRALVDASVAKRRALYLKARPLFPLFERYVPYCDDLAGDIGCMPPPFMSLSTLLDPRLALAVKFGPMAPAQYRLRGPHAMPDKARDLLLTSNL